MEEEEQWSPRPVFAAELVLREKLAQACVCC
jgi:hypothetical protein